MRLQEKIKTEVKDRLDSKTTSPKMSRVRNWCLTISAITGNLLWLPLPKKVHLALTIITGITGTIAGRAHLDKSNKLILTKK